MKRCLSWCLATLALLVLTACSTPTAVADTDDFRWMGTVVAGLSETGEQAEELVIPASATEVSLDLTGNTVLRRLSFESDDTVIRNLILKIARRWKKSYSRLVLRRSETAQDARRLRRLQFRRASLQSVALRSTVVHL